MRLYNNDTDPIEELRKWAQLAGVWGQPHVRRMIVAVSQIPDPQEMQAEAAALTKDFMAMAIARASEAHPYLPYPDAAEIGEPHDSDIGLGFIDTLGNEEPHIVTLPQEALNVHMLVAGPTGKGKSMFVTAVVLQLMGPSQVVEEKP